ncbi:MAG TPA: nuclear transport factor 2 family protein [Baekduia sp.]|nr:nuclear transport factor 2 family protein [Baekduia sp.]
MSETIAEGPIATVQQWFHLVNEEDFANLSLLVHDDLVTSLSKELPYGSVFHGMSGLIEARNRVMSVLQPHGPPTGIQIYETVDGNVTVRLHGQFVVKGTGKSVEQDVMEFFGFRDGKIAEVDIYYREPGAIAALIA